MALGFFRRRQKMVIIIMVVLMLSFLLGSYGVSTLFRHDPSGERIADTRVGEVTRAEWWQAEADLAILRALGLGNPIRARQWPLEAAYVTLLRNGDEKRTRFAYLLLLKEARHAGVLVTEADVDEFFRLHVGPDPSAYKSLISALRDTGSNWTERTIRAAVADWLMVYRNYLAVRVDCPPSETELEATFRDIAEKMSLAVARIEAEDFLSKVPDPNDQAVMEQFIAGRASFANTAETPTDMGFGYRQPPRAAVQYLLVNGEAIARIAQPEFVDIEKYWRNNQSQFYREEPVSPTTAPADANTPMRRVPLTFAEAKRQIVELLHGPTVRGKVDAVTAQAQKAVQSLLAGEADPNTVYEKVVGQMTLPAKDILARELKDLKIENATVADAVGRLADAAELPAICFPWGKHGSQDLDPNVRVTITGESKTLRGALDDLCRQTSFPRLEWARCRGMGDTIFSVKIAGVGIDLFPIRSGTTGLMTLRELVDDKLMGSCWTSSTGEGMSLAQVVASAKGLAPKDRTSGIKAGDQGMPMHVIDIEPGRLLWRLASVEPAHVPMQLTDELREQVVRDLKMVKAMELARQKAVSLRDAAEKIGLAAAAGNVEIDVVTTGLFERRQFNMTFTDVPMLDELDSAPLDGYFIQEAFELAYRDSDANTVSRLPVKIIPLPIKQRFLVVEKIGFEPATRVDFEMQRRIFEQLLNARQQGYTQVIWFSHAAIVNRVGFQERVNG